MFVERCTKMQYECICITHDTQDVNDSNYNYGTESDNIVIMIIPVITTINSIVFTFSRNFCMREMVLSIQSVNIVDFVYCCCLDQVTPGWVSLNECQLSGNNLLLIFFLWVVWRFF